ncbi:hypothetical protein P7C71_g5547, partial [Lecanoromycetidae sp. Uapishka_2]
MRTSVVISVLLGAGALGHPTFKLNNPLAHLHHHHKRQGGPSEVKTYVENGRVVVDDIFVKTVYGNSVPAPSPVAAAPAPVEEKVAEAPVVTVVATPAAPVQVHEEWAQPQQKQEEPQAQQENQVQQQQQQAAPVAAAAPVQTQAAAPASSPASSGGSGDGSPMSGGKSILTTANFFRKLQGYNELTYDDTLQGNSVKTGQDNGGNKMKHELNPGSSAQCIAESENLSQSAGDLTQFDLIWLGWLCEIPAADLGDMCTIMNSTTNMHIEYYYGDPGHANILRTASYTKLGCSYQVPTLPQTYAALWTCDFA